MSRAGGEEKSVVRSWFQGALGSRMTRSPHRLRQAALATTPYLVLAGMIVYFSAASPVFLTSTNIQNIVRQSSILLIVSLAASFVILMGSIDLSVGSIVTLCGIMAALLSKHGSGEIEIVLVVTLIGASAGALNGVLFAYVRLPSFLVTLGTSYVFSGIALKAIGGIPVVLDTPHLSAVVNAKSFAGIPNIGLFAFGFFLLSVFLSRATAFGRYVSAVGGGERVALLSGVNVNLVKALTFALSGCLCAVGGVLLAVRISSGSPGMGDGFLLSSIASVVISGTPLTGGVGGPHRTLLGVFILGVLLNGMTLLSIDPFTQLIVQGVVVIVAVAVAVGQRKMDLVK